MHRFSIGENLVVEIAEKCKGTFIYTTGEKLGEALPESWPRQKILRLVEDKVIELGSGFKIRVGETLFQLLRQLGFPKSA